MGLFNKKELERIQELERQNSLLIASNKETKKENDRLNSLLEKSKVLTIEQQEEEILNNKKIIDELKSQFSSLDDIREEKNQEIINLQYKRDEIIKEIDDLNVEVDYIQTGLSKPNYQYVSSDEYKAKLEKVRNAQKCQVKNDKAVHHLDSIAIDGNKNEGKKFIQRNIKMILRSFNNECTVLIGKVRFGNLEKVANQIVKVANQLNTLYEKNYVSLDIDYINLKLEELNLVYECALKKQEEKELLKEQRAEEREQAKLKKEIEAERKKFIKEQAHYLKAKEKYETLLAAEINEEEKNNLLEKINELNNQLSDVEKGIADIDYREANKRAGYVYVISNIGSFGEGVYKIGITRRLEPLDRIDELGSASVPFNFDVHAMIFSNDAPSLESKLHQKFDDKKVNMVNGRKEFFKVPLKEIMDAVKEFHEQSVEFTEDPEAIQYRETLAIMNHQEKEM